MKVDCLIAEIGSTTTSVNAFNIHKEVRFVGKGTAATTVNTDVRDGLNQAVSDLKTQLGIVSLDYDEMFASSSAAGGLRMSVHGLVYEMTVRAAKEAALNAGANIHLITSGDLDEDNLEQIRDIKPNIILISGGTDYGEKHVAFNNLLKVESLELDVPIIYAGNIDNHHRIKKYFEHSKQKAQLKIVENVYPRVDYLNILPLRKRIYETFEEHIIHAKGMKDIRKMVNASIMPTPGSVMESTMLLSEKINGVLTLDVGGATTDVHSVALPSDEYKKYAEGEAKEKRTVEGDLGVFINHKSVLETMDKKKLLRTLNITEDTFNNLLDNFDYLPKTDLEKKLVYALTKTCVFKALDRHVGDLKKVYTSSGQKVIPEGKDLTQVNTIILTGGALIHLDNTERIIKEYIENNTSRLLPGPQVRVIKDTQYLMSSIGVLSLKYPQQGLALLLKSLNIKG